MARSRREDTGRSHGDLGYVGERVRNTDSYGNNKVGNSVDAYLTYEETLPSNVETIKYSMRSYGPEGYDISDMPVGPNPVQSGPYFGDVHAKDGTPDRDNIPWRMEYSRKPDKAYKQDRQFIREDRGVMPYKDGRGYGVERMSRDDRRYGSGQSYLEDRLYRDDRPYRQDARYERAERGFYGDDYGYRDLGPYGDEVRRPYKSGGKAKKMAAGGVGKTRKGQY